MPLTEFGSCMRSQEVHGRGPKLASGCKEEAACKESPQPATARAKRNYLLRLEHGVLAAPRRLQPGRARAVA